MTFSTGSAAAERDGAQISKAEVNQMARFARRLDRLFTFEPQSCSLKATMPASPPILFTRLAVSVLAAATSLFLIAGFFGKFHPALDATSHLRIQSAVFGVVLALALLIMRRRRLGGFTLLAAALGLATSVGPQFSFPTGAAIAASTSDPRPAYKLLQLNLLYNNSTPEKVLSLIGEYRPDVITVEEVSGLWVDKLGLIAAAYPYRLLCRSVAIISRRPFDETRDKRCEAGQRFASAAIDFGGRTVGIAVVHLRWPWPYSQAAHLDRLAPALRSLGPVALLGGDFNAATWSATMQRIANETDMMIAGDLGATWLSRRLPRTLRAAGLPLDHVLAKGLEIRRTRLLHDIGSDHWPLLVEFSFSDEDERLPTAVAMAQ